MLEREETQENSNLLWGQWEGLSGRFYCVHMKSILPLSLNMADISESPSKEYYFTFIQWHWMKETVSEKPGVFQLLEFDIYRVSVMLFGYDNREEKRIWCYNLLEIYLKSHL